MKRFDPRVPLDSGSIITDPKGNEYRITRLLGSGGTCFAYEGFALLPGKGELRVVIKEFCPLLRTGGLTRLSGSSLECPIRLEDGSLRFPNASEEFIAKERRFLRSEQFFLDLHNDSLSAASVISLYQSFEALGTRYIVFDTKGSEDLDAFLTAHPVDDTLRGAENLALILEALCCVSSAVGAIHNLGYLHLDVKPVNFLLGRSYHLYAECLDTDSLLTAEEIGNGTVDYSFSVGFSAPEVISAGIGGGDASLLGCASDVYSIAAILQRVILSAGSRAAAGGSCEAAAPAERRFPESPASSAAEALAGLSFLTPAARSAILTFLAENLSENPDDRLQDMDEVIGEPDESGSFPERIGLRKLMALTTLRPLSFTEEYAHRLSLITGRGNEMNEYRDYLLSHRALHICAPAGYGKTSLGLKLFSELSSEESGFAVTRFIKAETEHDFRASDSRWSESPNLEEAVYQLIRRDSALGNVLLVFDNIGNDMQGLEGAADDFRDTVVRIVNRLLSTLDNVYIITTSRSSTLFSRDVTALDEFSEDDAIDYLLREIAFPADEADARAVISSLGRIPIVLEAAKMLAGLSGSYSHINELQALRQKTEGGQNSLDSLVSAILAQLEQTPDGRIYRTALLIASLLDTEDLPLSFVCEALTELAGTDIAGLDEETLSGIILAENTRVNFFKISAGPDGGTDLALHHSYQRTLQSHLRIDKKDHSGTGDRFLDAIHRAFLLHLHPLCYYADCEFSAERRFGDQLDAFFANAYAFERHVFHADRYEGLLVHHLWLTNYIYRRQTKRSYRFASPFYALLSTADESILSLDAMNGTQVAQGKTPEEAIRERFADEARRLMRIDMALHSRRDAFSPFELEVLEIRRRFSRIFFLNDRLAESAMSEEQGREILEETKHFLTGELPVRELTPVEYRFLLEQSVMTRNYISADLRESGQGSASLASLTETAELLAAEREAMEDPFHPLYGETALRETDYLWAHTENLRAVCIWEGNQTVPEKLLESRELTGRVLAVYRKMGNDRGVCNEELNLSSIARILAVQYGKLAQAETDPDRKAQLTDSYRTELRNFLEYIERARRSQEDTGAFLPASQRVYYNYYHLYYSVACLVDPAIQDSPERKRALVDKAKEYLLMELEIAQSTPSSTSLANNYRYLGILSRRYLQIDRQVEKEKRDEGYERRTLAEGEAYFAKALSYAAPAQHRRILSETEALYRAFLALDLGSGESRPDLAGKTPAELAEALRSRSL